MTALDTLSPLDGRYLTQCHELRQFFSERALIEQRLRIECQWLLYLDQVVGQQLLDGTARVTLEQLVRQPPADSGECIKQLEKTTNHDVKAVEYYLRQYLADQKIADDNKLYSLLHFALTSEDVNNLAYTCLVRQALHDCLLPAMQKLVVTLRDLAINYADQAMLARTHGQPASPTTMGKELAVFCWRLHRQVSCLKEHSFCAKVNGATGNYNALAISFPDIDWPVTCKRFLNERFNLADNPLTTQIEDHDNLLIVYERLAHFNCIAKGLAQDIWHYISLDYFKLAIKKQEIGSSTMPQKINPIDFENAEGNLGVANSLIRYFSDKLPISRLQRDLSDSTVLRTLGTVSGHSLLAYRSLAKGLAKIKLHPPALKEDLNNNWAVLAEAVQTVLRKHYHPRAYELVLDFSRQQTVTADSYRQFVKKLPLPTEAQNSLLALTPDKYLGYASQLARTVADLGR